VTLEYLTERGTFWWILVRTFGQKKCPKRWFWAFWYTLVL